MKTITSIPVKHLNNHLSSINKDIPCHSFYNVMENSYNVSDCQGDIEVLSKSNSVKYFVIKEHNNKIQNCKELNTQKLLRMYQNFIPTIKDDEAIIIPATVFQKIDDQYKRYLDFFERNNIIHINHYYNKFNSDAAITCKQYKLIEKHQSEVVVLIATDKTYIKERIEFFKSNTTKLKACKSKKETKQIYATKHYIKSFISKIDFNSALNAFQSISEPSKRIANIKRLETLKSGKTNFSRNKTNLRLDHAFTNISKEIFKHLKSDFISIDISNSQPYFLGELLMSIVSSSCIITNYFNNFPPSFYNVMVDMSKNGVNQWVREFLSKDLDKQEVELFYELVCSGKFYEFMVKKMFPGREITNELRAEVKVLMLKVLYSNNHSFIDEKKVFESIFPTISSFMKAFKRKFKSNLFPVLLQQIESYVVIDLISKEFSETFNDNFFTKHDSWVITENNKENLLTVVQKYIKANIKIETFDKIQELVINDLKEDKVEVIEVIQIKEIVQETKEKLYRIGKNVYTEAQRNMNVEREMQRVQWNKETARKRIEERFILIEN